jgi:hypothetical protein
MRASFSRHRVVPITAAVLVAALLLSGSSEQVAIPATVQEHALLTPAPHSTASREPRAPRQLAKSEAMTLLAAARRTADASKAEELFASRSWYRAPPPAPPPPPAPVEAPTAPPLPFRFLGAYSDSGGPTVYFITRDDRVFDVKPGDTLDQTYSVDAIQDGKLVFTYKPLNVRQFLPMGDGS